MLTHDKMVKKMLSNPKVKTAYDSMEDEFIFLDECLKARKRAKITQEELASRMGTKAPAIARIESGGGKGKHSPTINTLRKYAEACGCKLEIKFKPEQKKSQRAASGASG